MIVLEIIYSLYGEKWTFLPVEASKFKEDDAMDTWSNIFSGKSSLNNFNFTDRQFPSYYWSIRPSSVHLFLNIVFVHDDCAVRGISSSRYDMKLKFAPEIAWFFSPAY